MIKEIIDWLLMKKLYECECRPVTKEAKKHKKALLKRYGYCPICRQRKNGGV